MPFECCFYTAEWISHRPFFSTWSCLFSLLQSLLKSNQHWVSSISWLIFLLFFPRVSKEENKSFRFVQKRKSINLLSFDWVAPLHAQRRKPIQVYEGIAKKTSQNDLLFNQVVSFYSSSPKSSDLSCVCPTLIALYISIHVQFWSKTKSNVENLVTQMYATNKSSKNFFLGNISSASLCTYKSERTHKRFSNLSSSSFSFFLPQ